MLTSMVSIKTADGEMSCFLARAVDSPKHPAVIVVMEAFGLNDHIKEVARSIAAEGYVALAPDVYYRQPGAVVGYDNLPEAIRLMTSLTDENTVKDMNAAVSYLKSRDFVRADRIGMTGFCMGGRITFLSACQVPGLAAAAPFYGGGIGGLLGIADRVSCPLLLFFGDQDPFIPNDEVERIGAKLKELKKNAEIKLYPGAPHGFFCNERDSYRPDAAADAWERLRKFFGKHLNA